MISDHRAALTVNAFAAFYLLGSVMACTCAVALAFPGTFLDGLWQLNPRAREGFASLGSVAVALMTVVSAACLSAAVGLWKAKRWGYRLAVALLLMNLTGDVVNVVLGTEPRAAVGIPIVIIVLWLLSRTSVRAHFR